MSEKKRVGRPPYPPEKLRTAEIHLRLTETERDAVKEGAARRQLPVNAYLRALVAADIAADGGRVSV